MKSETTLGFSLDICKQKCYFTLTTETKTVHSTRHCLKKSYCAIFDRVMRHAFCCVEHEGSNSCLLILWQNFIKEKKKINKWGFLIYEEMKKNPCKLIYNSAMCFLDTLKFWIKFYAIQHWLDQRSMISVDNTLIYKNMNERELAREFLFSRAKIKP